MVPATAIYAIGGSVRLLPILLGMKHAQQQTSLKKMKKALILRGAFLFCKSLIYMSLSPYNIHKGAHLTSATVARAIAQVVVFSRPKCWGTFWALLNKKSWSPEVALVDFSPDVRPWKMTCFICTYIYPFSPFGDLESILRMPSAIKWWLSFTIHTLLYRIQRQKEC